MKGIKTIFTVIIIILLVISCSKKKNTYPYSPEEAGSATVQVPSLTATGTAIFTATNTPTNIATNSQTPAFSVTTTSTADWSATASSVATNSSTVTFTETNLPSATNTLSPTPINTLTHSPTNTNTATESGTQTMTASQTGTTTNTLIPSATSTPTNTLTFTETVTGTQPLTWTPTNTGTNTATATFTLTFTPTNTATNSVQPTNTSSETGTFSQVPTLSLTTTFTEIDTATSTATNTPSSASTATFSNTPTHTSTFTFTNTVTPTTNGTPDCVPNLSLPKGHSPINCFADADSISGITADQAGSSVSWEAAGVNTYDTVGALKLTTGSADLWWGKIITIPVSEGNLTGYNRLTVAIKNMTGGAFTMNLLAGAQNLSTADVTIANNASWVEYSWDLQNQSSVPDVGFQVTGGPMKSGIIYFDVIALRTTTGEMQYDPRCCPQLMTPSNTPTNTRTPTNTKTPTFTVTPGGPTETPTATVIYTPCDPEDPHIQYFGRWDFTDVKNPKGSWGCVYIKAKFEGTSIKAKFSGSSEYWQCKIDGNEMSKFAISSSGEYTLATGLSDTVHTLELFRRSGGSFGITTFSGFVLDTGKVLVEPEPTPQRKIEVIGDSISVGFGNEGSGGTSASTENGYMAYGPQLARMFNAQWSIIAHSGQGIYRNLNESMPPTQDNMTDEFLLTWFPIYPTMPNINWDFGKYKPDVFIIFLGTNDFSGSSPYPSQTDFESTYSNFIDFVRIQYSDAVIFCVGPLVPVGPGYYFGDQWDTCRAYINNVVIAKNASGDPNVYYCDTSNGGSNWWLPNQTDYIGDWTHPTVAGHTIIAQQLYNIIQPIMGW